MGMMKRVHEICTVCAGSPDKCRRGCQYYMGKQYEQCPVCKQWTLEEVNVGDDRQLITITKVCESCGYVTPQGRML